jgi:hypothetical protein
VKRFLLLSFILSLLALVPHPSPVRASFVDAEVMSAKLIELTNKARQSAGLPALSENSALTRAAYAKANDMLAQNYFSHTAPNGKAFYRWVDGTGYVYSAVAENLAVNLNLVSAEEMVASWLNSPGHRANLLSGAYTEAGMGVSSGTYQGQPAVFAVHVFARPQNKTAVFAQIAEPITASPAYIPEPKTVAKTQLAKRVVKNVDVLGESISAEIISPQVATLEEKQEMKITASSSEISPVLEKKDSKPHKSLLQKILDFFFGP